MIYDNQYCLICGHKIKNTMYKYHLCRACHYYYANDITYPIPPMGQHEFLDDKEICHVCGQAHKHLKWHVPRKHKIHYEDYKKLFNLS